MLVGSKELGCELPESQQHQITGIAENQVIEMKKSGA